jgi:hypothetical protein
MNMTRRTFAAVAALAPAAFAQAGRFPIGLHLGTVLNDLRKDEIGMLRAVARMGYELVEFHATYWIENDVKEIRKVLDGEGIRCTSTRNSYSVFSDGAIGRTIELN